MMVSTGALVAWVRIPTLHFNDSNNIYIYYGKLCSHLSNSKCIRSVEYQIMVGQGLALSQ